MRIWTENDGAVYVNAISRTANGEDVDGHLYVAMVGSDAYCIQFQKGPVKEVGVNGLTTEALLSVLMHRVQVLDKAFPCEENKEAVSHMTTAMTWLMKRTAGRVARGVEGLASA